MREKRGFTLIELLVTLVVAGVMFLGVTQVYAVVLSAQRDSDNRELATRIAMSEIETVRNTNYTSLQATTGTSCPNYTNFGSAHLPSNTCIMKVSTAGMSGPTLRDVEIIITYNTDASWVNIGSNSHKSSVTLETIMGVLGTN